MFVGLAWRASHGFLPTLDSVENHILQAKLNFCQKFVSWWSRLSFVQGDAVTSLRILAPLPHELAGERFETTFRPVRFNQVCSLLSLRR